jgi:hypothetical protein
MFSFPTSVRLSIRVVMELGSYKGDFYQIWYSKIFRKSVGKMQDLLKSDMNNG